MSYNSVLTSSSPPYRFWFPLLVCIVLIAGIVIVSTSLVPYQWRLTGNAWAVIFPLSVVCACHILFPVRCLLFHNWDERSSVSGNMLLETFAIYASKRSLVRFFFFASAFGHLTTPFFAFSPPSFPLLAHELSMLTPIYIYL